MQRRFYRDDELLVGSPLIVVGLFSMLLLAAWQAGDPLKGFGAAMAACGGLIAAPQALAGPWPRRFDDRLERSAPTIVQLRARARSLIERLQRAWMAAAGCLLVVAVLPMLGAVAGGADWMAWPALIILHWRPLGSTAVALLVLLPLVAGARWHAARKPSPPEVWRERLIITGADLAAALQTAARADLGLLISLAGTALVLAS